MTEPCFLADAMLGKLTRYLRILGYSAEYTQEEDSKIVQRFKKSRCIILTRDKFLCQRLPRNCVYVNSIDVKNQLIELKLKTGIRYELPITPKRCSLCNAPLRRIGVMGDREVWVCTKCGQPYWRGSHIRRIENVIREINMMFGE
ncbi:Mut7-C RNAse domain-containing protein [Ignicoccus islandicus]